MRKIEKKSFLLCFFSLSLFCVYLQAAPWWEFLPKDTFFVIAFDGPTSLLRNLNNTAISEAWERLAKDDCWGVLEDREGINFVEWLERLEGKWVFSLGDPNVLKELYSGAPEGQKKLLRTVALLLSAKDKIRREEFEKTLERTVEAANKQEPGSEKLDRDTIEGEPVYVVTPKEEKQPPVYFFLADSRIVICFDRGATKRLIAVSHGAPSLKENDKWQELAEKLEPGDSNVFAYICLLYTSPSPRD